MKKMNLLKKTEDILFLMIITVCILVSIDKEMWIPMLLPIPGLFISLVWEKAMEKEFLAKMRLGLWILIFSITLLPYIFVKPLDHKNLHVFTQRTDLTVKTLQLVNWAKGDGAFAPRNTEIVPWIEARLPYPIRKRVTIPKKIHVTCDYFSKGVKKENLLKIELDHHDALIFAGEKRRIEDYEEGVQELFPIAIHRAEAYQIENNIGIDENLTRKLALTWMNEYIGYGKITELSVLK